MKVVDFYNWRSWKVVREERNEWSFEECMGFRFREGIFSKKVWR